MNTEKKKFNLGETVQNAMPGAISFVGSAINAFSPTKNTQQLLSDAGTSTGYINGIAYQQQNAVDQSREMSELSKENTSNTLGMAAAGASLGSSLGPIGSVVGGAVGAIGGLFGASRRKRQLRRKIFNAQQLSYRTNNSAQASANSDFLEQNEALKYGPSDGGQQMFLNAYHGKDSGTPIIQSSVGRLLGRPNARVAGQESIVDNIHDPYNITGHIVRQGQRGVDGPLAHVNNGTVIFGNDVDLATGIKFMDEAAPYTAAIEMINKKYGKQ